MVCYYEGEFFNIRGMVVGNMSLPMTSHMTAIGNAASSTVQKHGEGLQIDEDGTIYEGSFANGLYHGKGEMTFFDGDICVGDFVNHESMDRVKA
eukprot:gene38381-47387_t